MHDLSQRRAVLDRTLHILVRLYEILVRRPLSTRATLVPSCHRRPPQSGIQLYRQSSHKSRSPWLLLLAKSSRDRPAMELWLPDPEKRGSVTLRSEKEEARCLS